MPTSTAVTIRRIALSAGIVAAIAAPVYASNVTIGNATPGDLKVLSDPDDLTNYLVITSGFERRIDSNPNRGTIFPGNGVPSFWLLAEAAGDAVVIWA